MVDAGTGVAPGSLLYLFTLSRQPCALSHKGATASPPPPLPPLPQTLNPKFHALTQVSYADSLKISLALKKALVDEGLLDVTQADMEKWLFFIMRSKVRLIASPRSIL